MNKYLLSTFMLLISWWLCGAQSLETLTQHRGYIGTPEEQASWQAEIEKRYPGFTTQPQARRHDATMTSKGSKPYPALQKLRVGGDEEQIEFYGNLIFSTRPVSEGSSIGIWKFNNRGADDLTPHFLSDTILADAGGTFYNNKYYFQRYVVISGAIVNFRFIFNLESNEYELYSEPGAFDEMAYGGAITFDPQTELAYGEFWDSTTEGTVFGSLNYKTWERKTINNTTFQNPHYLAMAIDAKGQIWGIRSTGDLYKISRTTGEETLVGHTGVYPAEYQQSAVVDMTTGEIYWAAVTRDGDGQLCKIDPTTGKATVIYNFPNEEEFVSMAIIQDVAKDKAPGKVTNLKASVVTDSPNDVTVSFTLPSRTFDDQGALSGTVQYTISVEDEVVKSGQGNPGETIVETLQDLPTGQQAIVVTPANSVGASLSSVAMLWVGWDQSQAPKQVYLSVAGEAATITWQAPSEIGVHDGPVDLSSLTYDVYRYPDNILIESGITETRLMDFLPEEALARYYYGVVANNHGSLSQESLSNRVTHGKYIIPPFVDPFDEQPSLSLYTILDQNNDNKTWAWDTRSDGTAFVSYETEAYGAQTANDWLITAPIYLQAGYRYTFSLQAGSESSGSTETFAVYYGSSADPAALTVELLPVTAIASQDYISYELPFDIAESGVYYFGIHCTSDPSAWKLRIDNVGIDAGTDHRAPDVVTDLQVTPGELGAKRATLTFITPATSVGGEDLTELTKVEIYRDDDLIATLTGETPGEEVSYVDESVLTDGNHTYSVISYNDYGHGNSLKVSAYIGVDIPSRVDESSIQVRDNLDGSIQLSWAPISSVGIHGGYVDPKTVTYEVFAEQDQEGTYSSEPLAFTTSTTAQVSDRDYNAGESRLANYAIRVRNDVGTSSDVSWTSIAVGEPLKLPIIETFSFYQPTYFWWFSGIGDNDFQIYNEDYENDAWGGSMGYISYTDNQGTNTFNSSKISLQDLAKPTLIFYRKCMGSVTLRILVDKEQDGLPDDLLQTIELPTASDQDAQWYRESIDLSAYTDVSYVILKFEVETTQARAGVYIDQIQLYDGYQKDLAVSSITTSTQMNMGETAVVKATIKNQGLEQISAEEYNVTLYAGKRTIQTLPGNSTLDSLGGTTTLEFAYTPSPADGELVMLRVAVALPGDEKEINNVDSFQMEVFPTPVDVVNDLLATLDASDGRVVLTWHKPGWDKEGLMEESFDDVTIYPAFSIGGISDTQAQGHLGDWILYDGDRTMTYTWPLQTAYPNQGARMAYQVFDGSMIWSDPKDLEKIQGHTGKQCLISFDAAPSGTQTPKSDDWLITPELSGEAQTVRFWAKSITNEFGAETVEVLYSTESTDLESFTRLTTLYPPESWQEYAIELPCGAKYMAVHNVSENTFGLMVDDFAFKPLSGVKEIETPESYNIWRDGEMIATVAGSETTYVDHVSDVTATYRYNVTAIFALGESAFSNTATINAPESIAEISATVDLDDADITVYDLSGVMIAQGRAVYRDLPRGKYVIRSNSSSMARIIIKE